jgi:hypothetical protein
VGRISNKFLADLKIIADLEKRVIDLRTGSSGKPLNLILM